jgi:energy-converting hydrogenase Eha subunit A
MEFLSDWQQPLLWASGLSLLAVVATVVGAPWLVTRLPSDYFSRPKRVSWRETSPEPVFAIIAGVLKNLLGLLLIMVGFILLVTPGQGILTLLIGLLLMNFPGKYRLEQWLVLRPGVLRGLNWLRHRQGHEPFDAPQKHPAAD